LGFYWIWDGKKIKCIFIEGIYFQISLFIGFIDPVKARKSCFRTENTNKGNVCFPQLNLMFARHNGGGWDIPWIILNFLSLCLFGIANWISMGNFYLPTKKIQSFSLLLWSPINPEIHECLHPFWVTFNLNLLEIKFPTNVLKRTRRLHCSPSKWDNDSWTRNIFYIMYYPFIPRIIYCSVEKL
jgi:hypothetical protein